MIDTSPFHQGELEVQQLAGEQAIASRVSNLIQESVSPRALDFIRQQTMIWIGVEDHEKLLWAIPLFGLPGFINPNKGEQLDITIDAKFSIPEQWQNRLQKGKSIACLVIELSTRRRIRINGVIKAINKQHIQISVQQAYPNCPKYIRKREMIGQLDFISFHYKSSGSLLNTQLKEIISRSDTAFVASIGSNGADVSHRGGSSGFIYSTSPNKITVPDYKGNGMFNTLGNFKANPNGGITIIEFNQGYYLQISGKIKLLFDQQHLYNATGGTNRLWELEIKKWLLFQLEDNIEWANLDFSPYNPKTLEL